MTGEAGAPKLLLSVFSTFAVGGPQLRFAAIANHFGRRYRHVIVAMDGVHDCKSRLAPDLDVELLQPEIRKGRTLANRRTFRNILRSLRPDCLITSNWGTIEWGMANWPRLVRHIHIEDGFGPEEAEHQLPRRALTRRMVLRNCTVVVPSRRLETIAIGTWRLNKSRVRYIPNGIDCARFSRKGIEPIVPRDSNPVVGTVALLRKEKNIARMIEEFRLIHDVRPCRLVIAGDGALREELEACAGRFGLAHDVVFTGYTADTERILAGLDIFILSSDTEQMPISVIEAMAAGLPIVSTNVGDVASIVARENMPFVVARDAAALASAAARLLDDPALRHKVGAANQARAMNEFSQENMFAAYDALFDGTV